MKEKKSPSRIENSLRNMKYAALGQMTITSMSFITRMIFVRYLPVEYLGLNGFFANIIAMLSLAELGIGSAITYSLYKPLADQDEEKIASLMGIYKKAYSIIGIVVALLGLLILSFLTVIGNDMPNINTNIYIIYIVFLLNTVMSYFAIYKQTLLSADQQEYVITNYRTMITILANLMQITFLVLTREYIIFLMIQVLATTLLNFSLSRKVDKKYPYLKFKKTQLNKEEIAKLTRNIRAMIAHKIGGFIVNGTDNILLTSFASLAIVGLYSNYLLIINGLWVIYNIFFRSFSASVGNLGAIADKEELKSNFNKINLIGFWLFGFSAICLHILFPPFITIWLGEEFQLGNQIVYVITLNFYLRGMRLSVLTFRDTLGLVWYDRHKPIFESIINLLFSIVLGIHFGAIGVLLGTTISTLLTSFWIEPYVLYKHGFKSSVSGYFKKYFTYSLLLLLNLTAVQVLVSQINLDGVIGFIVLAVACVCLSNVIFIAFFCRTQEFRYFIINMSKIMRRRI